jgi:DNA-directed RNA polymerase subunit M/transcription elongation factor TFIIS
MSSKVKGCLACENAGREKKAKRKEKERRRIRVSPEQKSVAERSEVRGQIVSEAIEEVRGQIAEVKKSERERHCEPRGSNLCNLTSNL